MSRHQRLRSAAFQPRYVMVGRPFFGKEEIEEVAATLASGWWASGPKTEALEKRFRQYIGSKQAVAVNSCTAGLFLALKTVGVGPGDEVITTPLTFPASANAIIHAGAVPVFADVLPQGGNIDPEQVVQKITARTKAILPVHLYGRPCQMDTLLKIARAHNLFVIEDAAHAVEGWWHNKKIGTIGDLTVFSFYASKNMATGEGGMVTTNNQYWAKQLRLWRFHGLSRDPYRRTQVGQSGGYQCVLPGYSFPLTDIQAALGIHQLARLEENLKVRQRYWQMYDEAFADLPGLELPASEEPNTRHARHLYTVLVKPRVLGMSRDKFTAALWQRRVGTIVHFLPVHQHAYYRRQFGYRRGAYPEAEHIGGRTVSLPLGAGLTKRDIQVVIRVVRAVSTL